MNIGLKLALTGIGILLWLSGYWRGRQSADRELVKRNAALRRGMAMLLRSPRVEDRERIDAQKLLNGD